MGPAPGRSLTDLAPLTAFRAAEWIGMHARRRLGLTAAEAYLRLRYRRADGERRIVEENLSRVLGAPAGSAIVATASLEAFKLYGRYWYDTFALRAMPSEELDRRLQVDGAEHLDEGLRAGHGVIAALPHMGNWDVMGLWLSINGYRPVAVAEELEPAGVFELFLRHRRALGLEIVPLSDGHEVGGRLTSLLAQNRLIALVADRALDGRGVPVRMFGGERTMPAGPALLCLRTGAPLVPAVIFTERDGWRCVIEPPLPVEHTGTVRQDVARLTQTLATRFERYIGEAPADWHMFQPAWDEDGEP